jgi:cysteine synthase A
MSAAPDVVPQLDALLLLPTPLVPVGLEPDRPPIWCKCEFLNPSGSTKDRIAAYILSRALARGAITPGAKVVEASSGSTGIALAMACARLRLRFTAVMPRGVSEERVLIVRAYGGRVEWSPKEEGIRGAMRLAASIAERTGAFAPRQFENPDNAAAHRFGTAVETFRQFPPGTAVDAVVSGVGTGGTLVGLLEGCHDHGSDPMAVAARPVLASGTPTGDPRAPNGFSEAECCSFSHRIPGVVDGLSTLYVPGRMRKLVEIDVDDTVALDATRRLIALGLPVGPSSGLNLAAALEFQRRAERPLTIVTVLPDRMERYFSTDLFASLRAGAGTSADAT